MSGSCLRYSTYKLEKLTWVAKSHRERNRAVKSDENEVAVVVVVVHYLT